MARKKTRDRETIGLLMDRGLAAKMRELYPGKISDVVNDALIFWAQNKNLIKNCETFQDEHELTCTACGAIVGLQLFVLKGKCPNEACTGGEFKLGFKLTQKETEILQLQETNPESPTQAIAEAKTKETKPEGV